MLLEVGIGAILLARPWFLGCTVVLWAAVVAAALVVGGGRQAWGYWLFDPAVATTLACVIHELRATQPPDCVGCRRPRAACRNRRTPPRRVW